MKESKLKKIFFKFFREIGIWKFDFKRFCKIKKRQFCVERQNNFFPFCECDHCRAKKIRTQFSMTQEEGFETLVVKTLSLQLIRYRIILLGNLYGEWITNKSFVRRLVNYLFAKKLIIWKCIITKRQMASKEGAHCTLNETQIVLISRICSWRTNFIANGKDLLNWIELFSHIILLFTNVLLLTIFIAAICLLLFGHTI